MRFFLATERCNLQLLVIAVQGNVFPRKKGEKGGRKRRSKRGRKREREIQAGAKSTEFFVCVRLFTVI